MKTDKLKEILAEPITVSKAILLALVTMIFAVLYTKTTVEHPMVDGFTYYHIGYIANKVDNEDVVFIPIYHRKDIK